MFGETKVLGELDNLGVDIEDTWLIIRDLNEVVDVSEKQKVLEVWKKWLYIKLFLLEVGGVALGSKGKRFHVR